MASPTVNQQYEATFSVLEEEKIQLEEECGQLRQTVDDLKQCVASYETTLEQLRLEKKGSPASSGGAGRSDVAQAIQERNEAWEGISNFQKAFADLTRRFERAKLEIESAQKREDELKEYVRDHQAKFDRERQKYSTLRQHAEEKIGVANHELERVRRATEGELTRLQVAIRKSELQAQSLQSDITRKTNENAQLTAICDELISKCGD